MPTSCDGQTPSHVKRFCTTCKKPLVFLNKRDVIRRKYCSLTCSKIGNSKNLWNQHIKVKSLSLRYCDKCKKQYTPTGAKQRWCPRCCPEDKHKHIMARYGLSQAEYKNMVKNQKGRCAICFKKPHRFMVDHDHACCPGRKTCGKCIRGLLCQRCNILLGFAEDNRLSENVRRYLDAVRQRPAT